MNKFFGPHGLGRSQLKSHQEQGLWSEDTMKRHINLKELEAARMAVDLIMLPGNVISLYMDSTEAVAFFNRQGAA